MKKIVNLIMLILVVSCFGCRSKITDNSEEKSELLIEQQEIGREFVSSLANSNKEKFVALLSSEVRNSFNHRQFELSHESIIKQYGKIEDVEFICFLSNPIYNVQIWRVRFKKDEIITDILFRILTTRNEDNIEEIVGFAFI